jgi:hypothetical protein
MDARLLISMILTTLD